MAMSTNPDSNKTQLVDIAKTVGAILGVPLALFAVTNSVIAQPITSLVVALIAAILISVWVVLSGWANITQIIVAWLALTVVVLAVFVIWPRTMTVEGHISDLAGNPVSNENVELLDVSNRMYKTETDADGYYRFTQVPTGKYRLQVHGSQVEGQTKGILVRVVQQNLAIGGALAGVTSASTPVSPADTPVLPADTPAPTNTAGPARTPPAVESATVAIMTFHDRYVTAGQADRDWLLTAELTELGAWETFTLLCLANDKVALKTDHDRYVTAWQGDRDWVLTGEMTALDTWEMFTLINAETGEQLPCSEGFELIAQGNAKIALKTDHGRYVSALLADEDWVLKGEATVLDTWEAFTVVTP
jgi:hypothetical protein